MLFPFFFFCLGCKDCSYFCKHGHGSYLFSVAEQVLEGAWVPGHASLLLGEAVILPAAQHTPEAVVQDKRVRRTCVGQVTDSQNGLRWRPRDYREDNCAAKSLPSVSLPTAPFEDTNGHPRWSTLGNKLKCKGRKRDLSWNAVWLQAYS